MPEPTQKQAPKPPRRNTNPNQPERADVEAEVPQAPAMEPVAEPTPVDATRGPRPRIERERE